MTCRIAIYIDQAGLQEILASGQRVTLVKNVSSDPDSSNVRVAWVAFSPFQSNSITWPTDYFIYATTTQLQPGAAIVETSRTSGAVQPGSIYTFQNGVFAEQPGAGEFYRAKNEQGSGFNFGIAQLANINGAPTVSPLNAVRVLRSQEVSFTPVETVSIFLSSFFENGTVISEVPSNAVSVSLSGEHPAASLKYNGAKNSFEIQPFGAGQT